MRSHLGHALVYLVRHPRETLLCGLGICAALCLLTLSRASQRGAWHAVMAEFEGLGGDTALLYVQEAGPLPPRFFAGLRGLCQAPGRRFVPVFEAHGRFNAGERGGERGVDGRLLTTTMDFLALFELDLARGRPLREEDLHVDRVLVGSGVADRLSVHQNEAHLKWDETWYQVVGVIQGLESGGGQVHQFLDVGHAALRIMPATSEAGHGLKFAVVQTAGGGDLDRFEREFAHFLAREGLENLKLELRLPTRQRRIMANTGGVLLVHGKLIALICLALGCLAVLISYQLQLRYRREEFGTLLALGASKAFIAKRLLAEVALLAGAAGLVGLFLGILAVQVLRVFGSAPMALSAGDVLGHLLMLALVAPATGMAPALAAMRLDPIQLLRLHR